MKLLGTTTTTKTTTSLLLFAIYINQGIVRTISLNSSSSTETVHWQNSRRIHKPWSSLASVDGLRNDEVAMLVTSTAFKEGYFLRAR